MIMEEEKIIFLDIEKSFRDLFALKRDNIENIDYPHFLQMV